eukprot:3411277-Lingulodinium_polyedra.AAC.1
MVCPPPIRFHLWKRASGRWEGAGRGRPPKPAARPGARCSAQVPGRPVPGARCPRFPGLHD